MKTKMWTRVNRFNPVCSKRSFKNYSDLIENCCLTHLNEYPFFSTALDLTRAGDWNGLFVLADSLSSQSYDDVKEHFFSNQFSLLVKKYPFPKGSINLDPEGQAINSFLKSEYLCRRRNQLFRKLRSPHAVPARKTRWYCERLQKMRSYISYVIGERPPSNVFDHCGFGPGASIGVHGNATNIARKILCETWSVTPDALTYASIAVGKHAQLREFVLSESGRTLYCADPSLFIEKFRSRCNLVLNNKICFVPKTVKTHRAIAIEPLLNGYLQKGIDLHLRNRMRRVGINLSDQQANQLMARKGSIAGSAICTIDLSAASDSLATEVVRELLPAEWFDLLDACRSKSTVIRGSTIRYEKFCSMGNGFCFPLESLIFAAVVNEAGGSIGVDSLVYGDDIIVPSAIVDRVIESLSFLGFKTNREKTFLSGPFRESCGADWFGGEDVRPFTLDFRIESIQSIFKLLNLTKRNARCEAFFSWLTFDTLKVPEELRLVRPFDGPPDSAVTVPLDVFLSSPFARFNRRTWGYEWKELLSTAIEDYSVRSKAGYELALVFGALMGVSSSKPFTLRRKTKTRARVTSGAGASSTWVPAPYDLRDEFRRSNGFDH